jgi:hypothetical protein
MSKLENCGLCGLPCTVRKEAVEAPRLGWIHIKCYDDSCNEHLQAFKKFKDLNGHSMAGANRVPLYKVNYNNAIEIEQFWMSQMKDCKVDDKTGLMTFMSYEYVSDDPGPFGVSTSEKMWVKRELYMTLGAAKEAKISRIKEKIKSLQSQIKQLKEENTSES